jgi:hypothetical protein
VRVAILSLTRDRLPYTKHCFTRLRENAGCDYDHHVLDQGSTDGTADWLFQQDDLDVTLLADNIGINQGINFLLDAIDIAAYDVIVKFDNDCELLTQNTLRVVSELVTEWDVIASPRIHGLRNPPLELARVTLGEQQVAAMEVIGSIFMAVPARVFRSGYRHNNGAPLWGDDDQVLCRWWRSKGGLVGYLDGYDANHYLTTDGQHADIPAYFERTLAEGKPTIL